jgi:hypothetical protein
MINLVVKDAEDFRQQIPSTGLFELFDVSVLVEASGFVSVKDLDEISTYLYAAINVVDFQVKKLEFLEEAVIHISIAEVPIHIAENRPDTRKRRKKS